MTDTAQTTLLSPGFAERSARRTARSALKPGLLIVALLIGILAFLIILPVGVLLIGSFLSSPPRAMQFDWSGLTLANYVTVLTDRTFLSLLANTVVAALIGTVGATVIGSSLAWLAVRTDVPARRLFDAVAVLPMFVPPLVGAFAWDMLASPRNGIINIVLKSVGIQAGFNIYSIEGIGFVFAIYYAPYVHLFAAAALRNMDPVLEEAAAMCGAGRLRTMFRITFPLVAPALSSATLLVFVLLIELFAIPAVLGEPGNVHVISTRLWELIGFAPPHVNEASALGVLLLMLTVALVFLQHRMLARRSFITLAGKGFRPRQIRLGAARWPLALIGVAYLSVVVLLPYAALLFIALRKNLFFWSVAGLADLRQLSLQQFSTVLGDDVIRNCFINSLLVSLGTVVIGGTLYFALSYVIHRTKLPGRRALDLIAVLPVAVPGLIIGLGYLWSWISLPIGLYGTLWIIILAYVAQFSPQGVRAISGSLVQIHSELEESARVCGAGFGTIMRRVVIPLAWPGILSAMILLLVLSFRELATALFLYTTNTEVFSLAMFDFWARGSIQMVAVMAIFQSLTLLALVLVSKQVGRMMRPS